MYKRIFLAVSWVYHYITDFIVGYLELEWKFSINFDFVSRVQLILSNVSYK
jgi:hypothetical protein